MLDVLNNFMKNLFTVKSSDCNTLLSRLQTSRAYSRIGRHFCFRSSEIYCISEIKRALLSTIALVFPS